MISEHLDDFLVYDCGWPLLVAVMVMRLGWVFLCGYLHLRIGPYRGCLPHLIPGHSPGIVWDLGFVLADIQ